MCLGVSLEVSKVHAKSNLCLLPIDQGVKLRSYGSSTRHVSFPP